MMGEYRKVWIFDIDMRLVRWLAWAFPFWWVIQSVFFGYDETFLEFMKSGLGIIIIWATGLPLFMMVGKWIAE